MWATSPNIHNPNVGVGPPGNSYVVAGSYNVQQRRRIVLQKPRLMRIWDNIDVWPDDLAVSPSLQSSARALRDLSKIRLTKPRTAHFCVVPGHCSAASGATRTDGSHR